MLVIDELIHNLPQLAQYALQMSEHKHDTTVSLCHHLQYFHVECGALLAMVLQLRQRVRDSVMVVRDNREYR